jgi:hypothetical protein
MLTVAITTIAMTTFVTFTVKTKKKDVILSCNDTSKQSHEA